MQTSLSFRCVHIAVCIGNDRCGPSGRMALPALVPCLHAECFEGDRDVTLHLQVLHRSNCRGCKSLEQNCVMK